MSFRLRPGAQNDLRDIWIFTAERWNLDQAEKYVGEIRRTIERLAAGEIHGQPAGGYRKGYRRQLTGSHVIYYQEIGADVEIVRVLHQNMKPSRHLR